MKIRFVARVLTLALALMMAVFSASAVRYVVFEDIPGDWNNYDCAVKWMNAEYAPSSENVWMNTDLLEGGQVAPGVFEYLADPAYAYENPDEYCGYLYIDTPGDSLYVYAFEGNWATKEYMFMNCVATDGMYMDIFYPSFDRDGKLLTTDRIYLYEYEVDGAWYYECVTFYFRYDGEETRPFLPEAKKILPVKEAADAPVSDMPEELENAPAPYEEVTEEKDIIISDNEAASVGIIGGADGPTSVIVSGPDGFSGFFESLISGVIGGLEEEIISTETEPVETEAEADEEITQAAEEDEMPANDAPASGGMKEFFSGVFGGFGK